MPTSSDFDGGPAHIVCVGDDNSDDTAYRFSFRKLIRFMGPGILMSIAYVDPGNLESDLQVGAQAGYVLLWLLLLSTAMGLVVQLQAAKLGVVTGKHLAQHCRQQYPLVPRIALWLMAEVAIIGSDVQEVIGSAIAISLLSGGRLPLWAGVLLTAADSFALLFIERLGIRVLEGFFGGMVGVMVATFGVMYARADVPVGEVVSGFTVPRLPRKDVPVAVALMGSLIMPHNIYLHSALVQTRRLGSSRPAAKREAMMYFGIESALSLVVAVVINLFITAVFARGFYGTTGPDGGPPDIGLENAGRYLGDTYGTAVVYIWALGLLAAGQSSTMTGTYTGQFVMSGYLDLKVSPWARVAITRAVAIAPTLVVALLCGTGGTGSSSSNGAEGGSRGGGLGLLGSLMANGEGSNATSLDQLNQGLNLLQSVQLPFALIPVLIFTSSRNIMGEFVNSWTSAIACWAIAAVVMGINLLALYEVAAEAVVADPWVTGVAVGVVLLLYFWLVGYLVMGPQSSLGERIWGPWKRVTGADDDGNEDGGASGSGDSSTAGSRSGDGKACTMLGCPGCYLCCGCVGEKCQYNRRPRGGRSAGGRGEGKEGEKRPLLEGSKQGRGYLCKSCSKSQGLCCGGDGKGEAEQVGGQEVLVVVKEVGRSGVCNGDGGEAGTVAAAGAVAGAPVVVKDLGGEGAEHVQEGGCCKRPLPPSAERCRGEGHRQQQQQQRREARNGLGRQGEGLEEPLLVDSGDESDSGERQRGGVNGGKR